MKNPLTPAGIEPVTFRFVEQHLNHCATTVPNTNEYQQYFLGLKSGWCVRLTNLPPSCAVVMKSGNLNFLEQSRPLWPVTGLIYV